MDKLAHRYSKPIEDYIRGLILRTKDMMILRTATVTLAELHIAANIQYKWFPPGNYSLKYNREESLEPYFEVCSLEIVKNIPKSKAKLARRTINCFMSPGAADDYEIYPAISKSDLISSERRKIHELISESDTLCLDWEHDVVIPAQHIIEPAGTECVCRACSEEVAS